MHVQTRTSWLYKDGNAEEEYEDASWPRRPVCREVPFFRAAVADGATETSFAREWAQLLVRAWCRGTLAERRLWRELPRLQRIWLESVATAPLPWYAQEKLRCGAFSSLVGLTLWDGGACDRYGGLWQATAIGDSCLFHLRGDRLLSAFPLAHSREFTNAPRLLSTKADANRGLSTESRRGTFQAGDVFYLMTDALAHWFLQARERGERPWHALDAALEPSTPSGFRDWIEALRREDPPKSTAGSGHDRSLSPGGRLRNDDVTVLSLTVA